MRYNCGHSLAGQDAGTDLAIDYVAGVPDSGTAHREQSMRELIARMKLVPIHSLIEGKRLLLVEDSIVRGTQFRGLTDFLYGCGAKELHVRCACPPLLYGCKYLNFTRSKSENELITRQVIDELEGAGGEKYFAGYARFGSPQYKRMVEIIGQKLNLTTLEYHSLDGLLGATGIERCKLCTYCWNGKE